MNYSVKLIVVMIALLTTCAGFSTASANDKFPNKSVRMLVPLAAGSAIDVLARWIAQKMSDEWGQQVLVDNRPSAGGTIASEYVLNANPDGHTLMMISIGHAGNATIYSKLSYDVIKDFAGISQVASSPNVLVVLPSLGPKSVSELIAFAKARPGQINFSSAGIGSGSHINGEMFKVVAGIDVAHVAYKGAPEALNNVLSGAVQYFFSPVMIASAQVRSGKVVALAVSTSMRSSMFPEVPTVAEAGLPGFDYDQWYGLVSSAKTPRRLIKTLNEEVVRVVKLPDMRDRMLSQGATPKSSTPEQFDSFIRSEVKKLAPVIIAAGARVN